MRSYKRVGPRVQELLLLGKSTKEIVDEVGCDPSNVSLHRRKLGLRASPRSSVRGLGDRDWAAMQRAYDEGISTRELGKKFNICSATLFRARDKGLLHFRTHREDVLLNPRGFAADPNYLRSEKHLEASRRGGGYRSNAGRGKGKYVTDSFGSRVYLQSTYEIQFATLLDRFGVGWERPQPLTYEVGGERKRYYPDFFLLDEDIYVDTKNDYLVKLDELKIDAVRRDNNVALIVVTKPRITDEFIHQLKRW